MSIHILLIEDDPLQREIVGAILGKTREFTPIPAANAQTALSILKEDAGDIQAVLLDLRLPDMDGMEVLETIAQRYPGLPVVILTGTQDVAVAVQAMKIGAHDFLVKPPEPERLLVSLRNALKISLLEKEVSRLQRTENGVLEFNSLIGHDAALAPIITVGRKAAASDIPVLLSGETGTGKEIFARAIHGESARSGKPFIAVNCGAIPANLVESTLFGHEKGAFTGAIAKAPGKFREADGGVIFLDEIGDLPPEAQAKLLRVLQQKEFSPVGASHPVSVNVRVMSATHRDLEHEVREGRFREDLYFRLNVLTIRLPALRERSADIPALARHFIARFAARESRQMKTIAPQALAEMAAWHWPGNVRELENAVHRAMVLSERTELALDDFSAAPSSPMPQKKNEATAHSLPLLNKDGQLRLLEEIERDAMEFGFLHEGGNVTRAAEALGIAKSTFYRRLKALRATQ